MTHPGTGVVDHISGAETYVVHPTPVPSGPKYVLLQNTSVREVKKIIKNRSKSEFLE